MKRPKIREIGKTVNRENLVYETNNYTFSFKAIRFSAKNIFTGKITLIEADKDQSSSLMEIKNFRNKIK